MRCSGPISSTGATSATWRRWSKSPRQWDCRPPARARYSNNEPTRRQSTPIGRNRASTASPACPPSSSAKTAWSARNPTRRSSTWCNRRAADRQRQDEIEALHAVLSMTFSCRYYWQGTEAQAAAGTSVGRLFHHCALANRDRIALIDGERQLTYGALDARTDRLGQALIARGVGRGDRVALLARNCAEYLEIEIACAKIGAITAA